MGTKKKPADHRILVVEDDEANIVLASINLDDLGYKYDIARSSKEALKFLKKNEYDLIFMDIHMADVDGLETTRLIRGMENSGEIEPVPIIALTNDDDKERFFEAGMDDFMPKPIRLKTLKACIDSNLMMA